MRLFFAVTLTEENIAVLTRYIRQLRNQLPEIKWVKPSNIHITLKFLGESNPQQKEQIVQKARNALAVCPVGALSTSMPGCFPNSRRARVFFLGLQANPALRQCHDALQNAMTGLGLEKEQRAFKPHLTLARIKKPLPEEQLKTLLTIKYPQIIQPFESIALLQSHLTPSGPIYKTLDRVALKK